MDRSQIKKLLSSLPRDTLDILKEEVDLEIKCRYTLPYSVDYYIELFHQALERNGIARTKVDKDDISNIQRYVLSLFNENSMAAEIYIPIFVERVIGITKGRCNLRVVLRFSSSFRKWLQEYIQWI